MDTASNVAAVMRCYEAYAIGDVEGAIGLLSPDVDIHGIEAQGEYRMLSWRGPNGFREWVQQIMAAWSHDRYELIRVEAEDEFVVGFVRVGLAHRVTGQRFDGVMTHVFR